MHAKRIITALRRAAHWSRRTKGAAQTRALDVPPPLYLATCTLSSSGA